MARGLSREQSQAKNAKKAGGNQGNTEGMTPQARAERYVLVVHIPVTHGSVVYLLLLRSTHEDTGARRAERITWPERVSPVGLRMAFGDHP
jgi:hypothetical protein